MKQILKIIQAIVFVTVISTILTGCGAKSPSAVVEATLAEIAKGENGDMSQYLTETLATEETAETEALSPEQEQVQELYFSQFSGKVLSEAIDGESASVAVEITSLNMAEIILSTMGAALGAAFSGGELSDEAMNQIMLEQFQAAQVQTRTGNISLQNIDGEWKVDTTSADFTAVIFGEVDVDLEK